MERIHGKNIFYIPGRVRLKIPALRWEPQAAVQLEKALAQIAGVLAINANPITGKALIIYDSQKLGIEELSSSILNIDFSGGIDSPIKESSSASLALEELPLRTQLVQVTGSGLVLAYLLCRRTLQAGVFSLASFTALISSLGLWRSSWLYFRQTKKFNNDFLIAFSILVSVLLGEGLTGLVVIWLVNLSELLETMTLDHSRRAIQNLLGSNNEQAWLLIEGVEVSVPSKELQEGDMLIVHLGEKIPVDGQVVLGTGWVNQASITGESVPVCKQVGDQVYAGTIVEDGTIQVLAQKVGDDTAIARIVHLVENAANCRAPIQNIADRYSEKIVPLSFLLAALVFLFTRDFRRSMTMLIVACPCAAGMATPTAISAAVGNAAQRGILIKGGAYLEKAGKIDAIFFDKTGTLTMGKPVVTSTFSLVPRLPAKEILALGAGCEGANRHPLAWAVVNRAQTEELILPKVQDIQVIVGYGVKGWWEGKEVLLGSQSLMEKHQVDLRKAQGKTRRMKHLGETILFLAKDGKLIGLIGVRDTIREESRAAIAGLREEGIGQIGLITGDHWDTAHLIGEELGLTQVHGQALPEDKLAIIQKEQAQQRIVAMVGDGVNDSPALAAADLGIAMGTGGTDVAIEAADIVLAGDDPRKIVCVVRLSKQTMEIIRQSFTWSIAVNALGIALGALNIINPLTGAILHNASTLTVVINSARLLYYQPESIPPK